MKHYMLFALLLLSGAASALDTLQMKTNITEVTLFFKGAQITRSGELLLKPGEQVVLIKGLSRHFQPASIQVSGLGDATLISHRSALIEEQPKLDLQAKRLLEKQEKAIEEAVFDLKQELSVYEHEEKILLQNSALAQNRTDAVQTLREGADFYRQRLLELRRLRTAVVRRIEAKQDELRALYAQLNQLQPPAQAPTQGIYLHLKSPKSQRTQLVLKYFDEAAAWTPSYEFRVSGIGKPMEVVYLADVHQFGGEDWQEVPLVLSTANPLLSSTKPQLKPWVLGRNQPGELLGAGQQQAPILQQRTGALRGKVVDADRPADGIPFANVVLEQNGIVYAGTTSDIEGLYSFERVQPGNYDLKVSYVGYNPLKMQRIRVQANRYTFVDLKMQTGVDLNVVDVVEYSVPVYAKDELSTGQTITQGEMSAMATRDVNSIASSTGGIYQSEHGSTYFIDGIRVRGSTNLPSGHSYGLLPNKVVDDIFRKPDEMLEYKLEGLQTIRSDGESQLLQLKRVEVPANYVYHLAPRVSREAFLSAELTNFSQLQLLDGTASVYYMGTYIGSTHISTASLSDTLVVGLGRDPGVQAIRVQGSDQQSRRFASGYVRQELSAQIVVRSSKDVPVQVVVDDQVPSANHYDVQIEMKSQPEGQLLPSEGLIRWQFELPAGGRIDLQQQLMLRYRLGT